MIAFVVGLLTGMGLGVACTVGAAYWWWAAAVAVNEWEKR